MGGSNSKHKSLSKSSNLQNKTKLSTDDLEPVVSLSVSSEQAESPVSMQLNRHQHTDTEEYDGCKVKTVFTKYYAKLCETLPTDEILPDLVSINLVTLHQMEEIMVEKTSSAKARALLNGPIGKSIDGNYPEAFTKLIGVMSHIPCCKRLSEEICEELGISVDDVMVSCMPEISKFSGRGVQSDDKVTKEISNKSSTDKDQDSEYLKQNASACE